MTTNPDVDAAFDGATRWREEALALRRILLRSNLTEELKWNKRCYSHGGRNICIIQRMNDFLALLFFKGALLKDPDGVLEVQGPNSRSGYRMRFTSVQQVKRQARTLQAYVREAVDVAHAGLSVEKPAEPEYPEELIDRFEADPELQAAFQRLTPGRQRGYLLHLNGARQAKTREARIDRIRPRVLAGKGLHDR